MANKKFWSGMLVMALVFGTAVIGCDNAANTGSAGGSDVSDNDITFTVTANGKADEETSSQLYFTFSEELNNLNVDWITIHSGTGQAARNTLAHGGALSGSGASWTLNITNVSEGTIRIQINKDGIERGRKTVIVHTDNATGENQEEAITLLNTQWKKGYISGQTERWYKFEAAGSEYRVEWKDRTGTVGVNEWAYIGIAAYESDGTTTTGTYDRNQMGIVTGLIISGETGVVYLKVTSTEGGNFEIRFVDTATMGPKDRIEVFRADATLNFSVEVEWLVTRINSTSPSIESTGYKIYRSDTKDGDYKELDHIPAKAGAETDKQSYTDTGLEAGKTYWYRVSGYNSKGEEGDMSAPKESTLVQDPDAGTILLEIGVEKEGVFTTRDQVDWYKFTAVSGKTYEVEWENTPGEDYHFMAATMIVLKSDLTYFTDSNNGWSFSGLSGTVYLKIGVDQYWLDSSYGNGYLGPYTIRVVIKN